jgi:hypothetical protein
MDGKYTLSRGLPTWRSLVLVGLLAALASSCGSDEAVLAKAIETIAEHTGTTPAEVEAGLRATFRGDTDAELTAIATKTADQTAWLDAEAARLAAQRVEIRKVIASSTCDWLQLLEISDMSDKDRNAALEQFIVDKLGAVGMSEYESKSVEIREGIIAQLQTYETSGQLDIPAAVQGSACFLFT